MAGKVGGIGRRLDNIADVDRRNLSGRHTGGLQIDGEWVRKRKMCIADGPVLISYILIKNYPP